MKNVNRMLCHNLWAKIESKATGLVFVQKTLHWFKTVGLVCSSLTIFKLMVRGKTS